MSNLKQYAAPAFFFGSLVFNYAQHKQDKPTVCSALLRPVLHTETTTGKIVAVSIWTGVTLWILPHLCREKNQHHIRA